MLKRAQAPFWRIYRFSMQLRAPFWGGCLFTPERQGIAQLLHHFQPSSTSKTGGHGCIRSAVDNICFQHVLKARMSTCSLPGPRDGGLGRESKKALICGRLGSSKDGRESLLLDAVLACCTGCCCAW